MVRSLSAVLAALYRSGPCPRIAPENKVYMQKPRTKIGTQNSGKTMQSTLSKLMRRLLLLLLPQLPKSTKAMLFFLCRRSLVLKRRDPQLQSIAPVLQVPAAFFLPIGFCLSKFLLVLLPRPRPLLLLCCSFRLRFLLPVGRRLLAVVVLAWSVLVLALLVGRRRSLLPLRLLQKGFLRMLLALCRIQQRKVFMCSRPQRQARGVTVLRLPLLLLLLVGHRLAVVVVALRRLLASVRLCRLVRLLLSLLLPTLLASLPHSQFLPAKCLESFPRTSD